MIRSIYTAVSGMITQEGKQDVITNNLANVNTIGFKGETLSVKEFDKVLLYNYDKSINGQNYRQDLGEISLGSRIDDVNTNFTQGSFEKTDKVTDFGMEGRGFFTVERNDGIANNRYYTRDGSFHINSRGYLVNSSGDNVLGINLDTREIEPIRVESDNLALDGEGNLNVDGSPSYRFYTCDFGEGNNVSEDYSALKKVGDNLYAGENARQVNDTVINQYNLEKANVNVIKEMVEMMTVMRNFETNQKVIQSLDETLGKAVNELGSVR
ncbi:flagellar hook-basal body complex protein [uncultured Clostridium sp.]|uniref:flagellar hook-basal body complex protein n=1 Tax=uncultured Clostridium sp. TaxID=59620 RepID=UPI0028E9CEEE|nr:flagellar hook-basal body complex protein [uncultured Clostridium sp.]